MRNGSSFWPTHRNLFHVRTSRGGPAFWLTLALAAIAAGVAVGVWQSPPL